jgi:hypothetical protein
MKTCRNCGSSRPANLSESCPSCGSKLCWFNLYLRPEECGGIKVGLIILAVVSTVVVLGLVIMRLVLGSQIAFTIMPTYATAAIFSAAINGGVL